MKIIRIIKERVFKAGYVLRTEERESPCEDEKTFIWTMAYTPDGDYIGNPKTARFLCDKRGIRPQKSDPKHGTCSIGFSGKDGKWYGWSHRAIFGFKIGSTCKKGDCHYIPDTHEELASDCPFLNGTCCKADRDCSGRRRKCMRANCVYELGKGEWTATTVGEARQMACDFAESVG